MNLKLIPLTVVTLLFFLPLQASSDDADRSEDEAAIKKVIQMKTEAFNKHDAAAQVMPFTKDADFYASNGTVHVVGAGKIEAVYKFIHNGKNAGFRNAKLEQKVTKIVFLSADIAIVTTELSVHRSVKDGGSYKNRGLRVMVKQQGRWKFKTYMNQRVVDGRVTPEDIEKATKGK